MAFRGRLVPIFPPECLISRTFTALAVPDEDQPVAVTHEIDDTKDWVLPENGLCDFIPIKRPSKIQVLVSNDTNRLFRGIYRQPSQKSDLIITWGESKGAGIVVWSLYCSKKKHVILPSGKIVKKMRRGAKFDQTTGHVKYCLLTPTERSIDRRLLDKMGHDMRKACRKASGRLRALGLTRVVDGERTFKEMTWYIRSQPGGDAGDELATSGLP